MGLDMYLYRAKKVEGLTSKEYSDVADFLEENIEEKDQLIGLDLETETQVRGANAFTGYIYECGEHFHWFSIFRQVGYWRKANHIHRWFVENVQDGRDECEYEMVSKKQLETLLELVEEALGNKEKALSVLPTQQGFFFGASEYGEWYQEDLELTQKIVKQVLRETDFDKEVIFYRSSW